MPSIHELATSLYSNTYFVVDVRSPAEYIRGHIPGAINIPLFSNEERAVVGTAYVQQSRGRAIELGMEFVATRLDWYRQTVQDVYDATHINPADVPIVMYCWRGGMRSASLAWFYEVCGYSIQTITGGYKAYRRMVLSALEQPWPFIVIGGHTGSGKTLVLHELRNRGEQVLDLESLCCHRGSAFGALMMRKQPRSEHAMNLVHQAMTEFDVGRPIYVEDESQHIGSVWLYEPFFHHIRHSPLLTINVPREQRAVHLASVYGHADTESLTESFVKIEKPLGGQRVKDALAALQVGDFATAASVALDHYDRAYDYGLQRQQRHVIGNVQAPTVDVVEITNQILQYGHQTHNP